MSKSYTLPCMICGKEFTVTESELRSGDYEFCPNHLADELEDWYDQSYLQDLDFSLLHETKKGHHDPSW